MSPAGFILAINLFVAGLFSIAFFLVAAHGRSGRVAVWFGCAYLFGAGYIVFEFLTPLQTDARLAFVLAFTAFLISLICTCAGIARRYDMAVPWKILAALAVVSVPANWLSFDMPRDSLVRMFAYQVPYAMVQTLSAMVVLRSQRRQALDVSLLVLFVCGAVQFAAKPFVALLTGGPGESSQHYIGTTYALFSQTAGAVLTVATGLLLLMVLVRDLLLDAAQRSETDALSGLLNRRGFEDRVEPGLEAARRGGVPASLIACDLDHFKSINDTWGHEVGDRVIRGFGELLATTAPPRAIAARIGGEEFAIFLPGTNLGAAQLYAEAVRAAFAALPIEDMPDGTRFTASFGVAEGGGTESLSDLRRRADTALYAAKRAGRDRVAIAGVASDAMPDHPLPDTPPMRRTGRSL